PDAFANSAVFVALVAPRRLDEWLPDILGVGATRGFGGGLSPSTAAPLGERVAVAAPADAFAERRTCSVQGKSVVSEVYSAAQYQSLRQLVVALAQEYPQLTTEYPLTPEGAPLRDVLDDAAYHK